MKATVFITGITGFVGQNLKCYLKNDFHIKGLSRRALPTGLTYNVFFEKNCTYDAIIHLAGKAHDLKKTSNHNEYFDVNYELTKNIYDQFLQSDAQQFIYISSVKAATDEVGGILTEEVIPNPVTAYGKSKLMAETYIMANLPTTKKVYILRPCMIHGPGNKGNLNLLYQLVTKRLPWPLGDFKNQRSFLSIENFCFVIKELLENKTIPCGVYNVSDDDVLSTNELIRLLSISFGKKSSIWSIPVSLIRVVAKLGDILHLPLNSERLQKLTENYVVSNQKIVKAIGKSLPVSSKDGLMRTFESFRK